MLLLIATVRQQGERHFDGLCHPARECRMELIVKLSATLVAFTTVLIRSAIALFWAPDVPVETLKSHWASGASHFVTIDVTATQFAVDRKIEQRKISLEVLHLRLGF
jgi:hypothetical protein